MQLLIQQKLRNFFHHVAQVGMEKDLDPNFYRRKCLEGWGMLFIEDRGQVDASLSIEKTCRLLKEKIITPEEYSEMHRLFYGRIENAPDISTDLKASISADVQALKMVEYFQKKSECKILQKNSEIDMVKEARIYKEAFAKWCLSDYQKPSFE